MAKKRKRRLKKSVKRGCALLIIAPLALYLILGVAVQRCSHDWHDEEAVTDTLLNDENTDLADRLAHLFHSPQRLDTSRIAIEVCDIASGTIVYSRNALRLAPPASCMKLLTAVTAMQRLGIDHTFVTQVVTRGRQQGENFHGTITLELDDDPMVESLEPMVDAIYRQGIRRVEGDIELRLMREDTLRAHSSAAIWDIPYHRLPILLKGRKRIEQDLHYYLQRRGITLSRQPIGEEPQPEHIIYQHHTPLTDVLAPMLIHSSNIKADGLFYHIGQKGTRLPCLNISESQWLVGQACLIDPTGAWQNFVVNDGSGLSPDNRLTAHFLVQLLQYAWEHEGMRHVLLDQALATPAHPVRHGSLLGRMSAPMFRGKVFVKTGTLTTIGLSSLAGYAQDGDGRWRAFAIINEDSPVAESRIFQDQVCRELVK